MNSNLSGWMSKVLAAIVLLVVVAYGARLVWDLLRPMLGALMLLAAAGAILGFVVRRHRRW